MPRKPEEIRNRTLKALEHMKNNAPCVTIAEIAKLLNIPWSSARNLIRHLTKSGLIIEITIAHRMLWCINEKAAATEIATLRHTTWRILCNSYRRFITPTAFVKLIANDTEARKVFARYINVDHVNANMLKFASAILEDLLGPPIDRTTHKVRFYVPRNICEKEPQLNDVKVKRYKQPHRIVTIKVSQTMYSDLLAASNYLNMPIPQIVRMAIARLISQYRHLLTNQLGADLKAN